MMPLLQCRMATASAIAADQHLGAMPALKCQSLIVERDQT
jgi:hypothetical protein